MFCYNCGNKIDDNAKFCLFCGANQQEEAVAAVAPVAAPVAVEEPVAPVIPEIPEIPDVPVAPVVQPVYEEVPQTVPTTSYTPSPEIVYTPAPVVEAPAPVVEAPAPVVEAPAPVVEAPAPVVEAPAPVVEAPAPVVEAPAPVVEAPAPVVEAPAPVAQYVPAAAPVQEQPKKKKKSKVKIVVLLLVLILLVLPVLTVGTVIGLYVGADVNTLGLFDSYVVEDTTEDMLNVVVTGNFTQIKALAPIDYWNAQGDQAKNITAQGPAWQKIFSRSLQAVLGEKTNLQYDKFSMSSTPEIRNQQEAGAVDRQMVLSALSANYKISAGRIDSVRRVDLDVTITGDYAGVKQELVRQEVLFAVEIDDKWYMLNSQGDFAINRLVQSVVAEDVVLS